MPTARSQGLTGANTFSLISLRATNQNNDIQISDVSTDRCSLSTVCRDRRIVVNPAYNKIVEKKLSMFTTSSNRIRVRDFSFDFARTQMKQTLDDLGEFVFSNRAVQQQYHGMLLKSASYDFL